MPNAQVTQVTHVTQVTQLVEAKTTHVKMQQLSTTEFQPKWST